MRRLRAWLITDPLVILSTILMGSISFFASLLDRTGRKSHQVARLWSRMLLAISGVRLTVEGREKLAPGQSYVFVSNHLSLMDTPLVIGNIPVEFRFLAKQGLFKVPFIGGHLKRSGHIAVPREDPKGSVRSMTEAARIIREKGVSVLIFPEGGRSEGELRAFKEGAGYIAIKAQTPVVPLSIEGTREVLPMGSVTVLSGPVRLRIGDPIPTAGLTLHDRGKLMSEARERIAALLKKEPVASR